MKHSAVALILLLPPSCGFPVQRQTRPHHFLPLHFATQHKSKPGTALSLLKGLVPSVDDDINAEIAEASLSPYELFQRELSATNSPVEAMKAVMKRQKDKSGDYENKFKILSDSRSYSDRVLLDKDHVNIPPSLSDLNQKQPQWIKVLWSRSYFRLFVFVAAFMVFPVLCTILNALVKIDPDEFDIINEQFTPGIGILYGTFVALTLDILYERQGKVQENASVEASLLSLTTQNILSLFRDEEKIAREATQIIADQVRIIVYRSRGAEMLNVMRSDPYARLMSLVDRYQRSKSNFTPWEEALIDGLRGEIPVLMEARARRLSDEASALPPTHFLVLTLLTALSLIGFTAATVSIQPGSDTPLEARMVFAGLTAIYVLFFNFSKDMNDPFDGVYQIKRSSAASYLLQIKWLVANQPWGKDIRFDTRAAFVPEFDGDVLEVTGKDGMKSLDATMNKMETVEKAITDSVIVSEAPKVEKELPVIHARDESVEGSVLTSNTPEEENATVKEPMTTSLVNSSTRSQSAGKPEVDSVDTNIPREEGGINFDSSNGASTSVAHTTMTPQEEAVAKKEPSAGLPDNATMDPSMNTKSEAINEDLPNSTIKDASAKDFLPSYFRTLSGFSEEQDHASDTPLVTVPNSPPKQTATSNQSQVRKSSAYFRSVGGFMHYN